MRKKCIGGEKFIQYLRGNLTRVLLFAVLLSTGLMMHFVTRAKYVSYVNSHNHAVAGEFYFTSNYLGTREEGVSYIISNWDRDAYGVSLRIQNFENALLYNNADTGCYYCVEARMYTGYADGVYSGLDENFQVEVSYGDHETITYNEKEYVYLPGMSENKFDKNAGTQVVNVKVSTKDKTKVTTPRYLEIVAKTMSPEEMKGAQKANVIETVPQGPVFDSELNARFALMIHSDAEIQTELKQTNNSSEVVYELRCLDTDGGAYSNVRVYFNSKRVKFEDSLKYEVKERTPGDTTDTYRYIEMEVYSTSITKLIFFKNLMNDTITSNADPGGDVTEKDIYYEVLKDSQE